MICISFWWVLFLQDVLYLFCRHNQIMIIWWQSLYFIPHWNIYISEMPNKIHDKVSYQFNFCKILHLWIAVISLSVITQLVTHCIQREGWRYGNGVNWLDNWAQSTVILHYLDLSSITEIYLNYGHEGPIGNTSTMAWSKRSPLTDTYITTLWYIHFVVSDPLNVLHCQRLTYFPIQQNSIVNIISA